MARPSIFLLAGFVQSGVGDEHPSPVRVELSRDTEPLRFQQPLDGARGERRRRAVIAHP